MATRVRRRSEGMVERLLGRQGQNPMQGLPVGQSPNVYIPQQLVYGTETAEAGQLGLGLVPMPDFSNMFSQAPTGMPNLYIPQTLIYGDGVGESNTSRVLNDPNTPEGFSHSKYETEGLRQQVHNQRADLVNVYGEEPPRDQPGALSRLFDLLQRGNYAVSEGLRSAAEARNNPDTGGATDLDDFAKGLWRGLTGKSKTTMADYLEEIGVKNKVARGVGGFALDVVTDPLSYVGIGVARKAGTEAVKKAGIEAAKNAVNTQSARNAVARATAEATKANQGKILKGVKRKEIESKVLAEIAAQAQKDAEAKFLAKNPGTVGLKIGGKAVGPQSEAVYRGFAKVGEVIGRTSAGQALNKAFRTAALYPGQINFLKRLFEGNNIGHFTEWEKAWRASLKGLTKAEREEITFAIENGTQLTGALGDVQAKAKAMLDDFFDIEAHEWGLLELDQYIDNYVPHYFVSGDKKAIQQWKQRRANVQAISKQNPDFAKTRTIPTLDEAIANGLKPVTDIGDVIAHRAAKHFKTRAQKQFMQEIASDYGIIVPVVKGQQDPVARKMAQEMGLKEVKFDGNLRKMVTDLDGNPTSFFLPPNLAHVAEGLVKVINDDQAAKNLLRWYDSRLAEYKTLLTVINPGHHVRNIFGDLFLNWQDGVVNPNVYRQAAKILGANSELAKKTGKNPADFKIRIGDVDFDARLIKNLYISKGVKTGYFADELGRGTKEGFGTKFTKAMEPIRRASEVREDWARLSHFLDVLKKEFPKQRGSRYEKLDAAANIAAQRVNKFNFDYGDFTDFEKKVAKRILPFYSWMRKNIPLQIEMLALEPGKMSRVPKARNAIEELLGTRDLRSDEEYTPIWETVPKWLRDSELPMISGGDNPAFIGSGLFPVEDIARLDPLPESSRGTPWSGLMNPVREILASTGPPLRPIFEGATGRDLFSGAPLPNEPGSYATRQIPAGRLIQQLLSADVEPERKSDLLLNYLTGAGKQRVTENRKRSELRRQQDPLQAIIAERNRTYNQSIFGNDF